jgi:hypothetical protein
LQTGRVLVQQGQPRAVLCEALQHGAANAFGRAGANDNLIGQTAIGQTRMGIPHASFDWIGHGFCLGYLDLFFVSRPRKSGDAIPAKELICLSTYLTTGYLP